MKTGRNDPCPCGSGKKYKKCCMDKDRPLASAPVEKDVPVFETGTRILKPEMVLAVLTRDIHFQGDWDLLEKNIQAHDLILHSVSGRAIKLLRKFEAYERVNAADFLDERGRALRAREIERMRRLRESKAELENAGPRTPGQDVTYHIACFLLDPISGIVEFRKAMRRHGDAAVDALAELASCGKYEYVISPGLGEAPTEACKLLGELRAARAVDKLLLLLDNEGDYLRDAASSALQKIGSPAVDRLISIIEQHPPGFLQIVAIETLAGIPDDPRIPAAAERIIAELPPVFPSSDDVYPDFYSFLPELLHLGDPGHAESVIQSALQNPAIASDIKAHLIEGYESITDKTLDYEVADDDAPFFLMDKEDILDDSSDDELEEFEDEDFEDDEDDFRDVEDDLLDDDEDFDDEEDDLDDEEGGGGGDLQDVNDDNVLAFPEFGVAPETDQAASPFDDGAKMTEQQFLEFMETFKLNHPYLHEMLLLRLRKIAESAEYIRGAPGDMHKQVRRIVDAYTDEELARDITLLGMEETDPKRQLAAARKALRIDPECPDAHTILGHAEDLRHALRRYRRATASAEKLIARRAALGDPVGVYWADLDTRPWMRAQEALAACLDTNGDHEEAALICHNLLRRDPADHIGAMGILVSALLALNRDQEALDTLDQYRDDEDAVQRFTRALLAFRAHGDSPDARALLAHAIESNPFVPPTMMKEDIPGALLENPHMDDLLDEAEFCLMALYPVWFDTPGALAWLAVQADS